MPHRGADAFLQNTFLHTLSQHYQAIEASEGRLREQMQALQRKLVRVVTENEALRHVVDKLQCSVLSLRRQLQHAGLALDTPLDESLLRPSPHQVHAADCLAVFSVHLAGLGGAAGSSSWMLEWSCCCRQLLWGLLQEECLVLVLRVLSASECVGVLLF
jgi:hypothetical protein